MTARDTHIKAYRGDLVCFSTGEYSDYSYTGHFVALEDITDEHFTAAKEDAERREREREEDLARYNAEGGDYPFTVNIHEAFIAHLIRNGLLASITVTEHHIGSYDEIQL